MSLFTDDPAVPASGDPDQTTEPPTDPDTEGNPMTPPNPMENPPGR